MSVTALPALVGERALGNHKADESRIANLLGRPQHVVPRFLIKTFPRPNQPLNGAPIFEQVQS